MITIALPKGRLGDKVYARLKAAGYGQSMMEDPGRSLILQEDGCPVRYLLVKPVDVPVYVEKGVADIGVAGKDVLVETDADVYEMLDLGLGKCHMAVAAPEGYQEDYSRRLRVATKFENIARSYYLRRGRDAEFIHLNGSIELAPVLGLADVIVDIVETGSTLKENHLYVVDRFMEISARLIVNRASYRFLQKEIDEIVEKINEVKK